MSVHQKISTARKKKGITQEQLAEMTNITVRTIQRIESGESNPRPYTLQSIANALELPFETLTRVEEANTPPVPVPAVTFALSPSTAVPIDTTAARDFLHTLCLSCFTYLVIPFVHVLVPGYILKRSGQQDGATLAHARRIIRKQLYWVAALHFLMLLTLAYNIIQVKYFGGAYFLHYLVPFFAMYFINAAIIVSDIAGLKKERALTGLQDPNAPMTAIVG